MHVISVCTAANNMSSTKQLAIMKCMNAWKRVFMLTVAMRLKTSSCSFIINHRKIFICDGKFKYPIKHHNQSSKTTSTFKKESNDTQQWVLHHLNNSLYFAFFFITRFSSYEAFFGQWIVVSCLGEVSLSRLNEYSKSLLVSLNDFTCRINSINSIGNS